MGRIVRAAPTYDMLDAANVDRTEAASPEKPDDYKDRVAKYVPSEVVLAYLAILSILKSQIDKPELADQAKAGLFVWVWYTHLFVVVLLTIFTPWYFWKFAEPEARPFERRNQAWISTFAFLVWALALGGPLFQSASYSLPDFVAGIALILFSLFSGLIVPRKKEEGTALLGGTGVRKDVDRLEAGKDATVRQACEKHWEAQKDNCSGFVNAVAGELKVTLTGNADAIVDQINGDGWSPLADGPAAKTAAEAGLLVVAGLKGADHTPVNEHGHVVVVVGGPLEHNKYPRAYWGKWKSVGKKDMGLNYAWDENNRDKVVYRSRSL